ncbi:Predicted permease [Anaerovirgula multivorans]|uniref:Predicted permease n=1 Tax=Anaerovirgula multivorans TaxID=312168 RepID=A0A239EXZ0_9FIRM|nr:permease [Anaerovirgula multivorans]SNS49620.1 Predicted permease [Anaerovirgula multivorans]
MKRILRRYTFALCAFLITTSVILFNREIGVRSFVIAGGAFKQMLGVLPPIMLLLGLMDEWIPRKTMMKYMGNDSGLMGIVFAILIGSLAAGPMYAAFPFTLVLLRKGVKFSNIVIFMNAWCVTKIPTLVFELTALGYAFTVTRLLINLPGIILMGYLVEWLLSKDEIDKIYLDAEKMEQRA